LPTTDSGVDWNAEGKNNSTVTARQITNRHLAVDAVTISFEIGHHFDLSVPSQQLPGQPALTIILKTAYRSFTRRSRCEERRKTS